MRTLGIILGVLVLAGVVTAADPSAGIQKTGETDSKYKYYVYVKLTDGNPDATKALQELKVDGVAIDLKNTLVSNNGGLLKIQVLGEMPASSTAKVKARIKFDNGTVQPAPEVEVTFKSAGFGGEVDTISPPPPPAP